MKGRPNIWAPTIRRFSSSTDANKNNRIRVSPNISNHLIFGANTDVGKTVISAGLVRASLSDESTTSGNVHYIKPMQCGGSDEFFVDKHCGSVLSPSKSLRARTLFQWDTPASPHVSSRKEKLPKSDDEVLAALFTELNDISQQSPINTTTWIETAGGVLSPSSASPQNNSIRHASGSDHWGWLTQGDLYQPLIGIAPVVLCGDGRLGGISATLSSLESLLIRGYDVAGIIMLETGYDNVYAIREYVDRKLKLRSGSGQRLFENPEESIVALPKLPPEPEPLDDWYASGEVTKTLYEFNAFLDKSWKEHATNLQKSVAKCENSKFIDSANGDSYVTVRGFENDYMERVPVVDACDEKGLGYGESSMALAAAAALGRYGRVRHSVMNHGAAMALSEKLIAPGGVGGRWAQRVMFTEDGKTAMQIAIQMGVSVYRKRHGTKEQNSRQEIDCFGCHTTGSQGESFLRPPTIAYQEGRLCVSMPLDIEDRVFDASLEDAFKLEERLSSDLYAQYYEIIKGRWAAHEQSDHTFLSVAITPMVLGADNIELIDPLWQRALADFARAKEIPVILDETSTGIYSLGALSYRDILNFDPDIAVYGGLLTTGIASLGTAVTTEEAYNAFIEQKGGQGVREQYGVSYANPLACVTALHALESIEAAFETNASKLTIPCEEDLSKSISKIPLIHTCFSVGTNLVVTVNPEANKASKLTSVIEERLQDENIAARLQGNAIHIMVSPFTKTERYTKITNILHELLLSFEKP